MFPFHGLTSVRPTVTIISHSCRPHMIMIFFCNILASESHQGKKFAKFLFSVEATLENMD